MTSRTSAAIYTIGHSRHSMETFIALLKQNEIERVIDVRGRPYSRHNPQFNRERVSVCLAAAAIDYNWSGKHLSGRPREARFYGPGGEVLWEKIKAAPEFCAKLDSIAADALSCRLVLVCAEEDPTRCHRRFLLTPPLIERGLEVLHLRGNGQVEAESALLEQEGTAQARAQRGLFE